MLGKVKQWLGIEGVKLELILPPGFNPRQGSVSGTVRLTSKHPQRVAAVKIVLVEKYARGKQEQQLVDEYELGRLLLTDLIDVPGEGVAVDVPFYLKFSEVTSAIDAFGAKKPRVRRTGLGGQKAAPGTLRVPTGGRGAGAGGGAKSV